MSRTLKFAILILFLNTITLTASLESHFHIDVGTCLAITLRGDEEYVNFDLIKSVEGESIHFIVFSKNTTVVAQC